jgi:L-threonylcarbamoyladenylate synthase
MPGSRLPIPDPKPDIEAAARRLREGGLAVFPTDTVMGLGCLARSPDGVRAVFELKGREPGKPLIIFVESSVALPRITGFMTPRVKALLDAFWPGALTAILPLKAQFPLGVGKDGSVGIRVPDHPVPLALVRACGGPLATTSANPAGGEPFRDAAAAREAWGNSAEVVDGSCGGVPSTVVDLTSWPPRILREGGISAAEVARAIKRFSRI